jgi:hypothetical protein
MSLGNESLDGGETSILPFFEAHMSSPAEVTISSGEDFSKTQKNSQKIVFIKTETQYLNQKIYGQKIPFPSLKHRQKML